MNIPTTQKPAFALGQVVATPAALTALRLVGVSPSALLDRHVSGDGGDLEEGDHLANLRAILSGDERVFSSYIIARDVNVWVITEADRSVTTLLLPEDY